MKEFDYTLYVKYFMCVVGIISGIFLSFIITLFIIMPVIIVVGTQGGLYTIVGGVVFALLTIPCCVLVFRYALANYKEPNAQLTFLLIGVGEALILYNLYDTFF